MRKSRFNEEQVTVMLREQKAGAGTAEMCCLQPTALRWAEERIADRSTNRPITPMSESAS